MADRPADMRLYAVVAEFDRPEKLVAAAEKARAEGFAQIEGFSPFPVDGLAAALGVHERAIAPAFLFGGIGGACIGFGLQVFTNLDFPLNVGGRPLIAWPAFVLITFEPTVLGAVLSGLLAMLIGNRLPRLNHPLFEIPEFHLASADKFFLAILAGDDPDFDAVAARRFLKRLKPVRVADAPFAEAAA